MERRKKDISCFVLDAFIDPPCKLLICLFLLGLGLWLGSHLVDIGVSNFFELVVVLELDGEQLIVVVAHVPEEVSEFMERKFGLKNGL